MANSPQAAKRARQNVVSRSQNVVFRTRFRTFQKRVVVALAKKDKKLAQETYAVFARESDVAAGKGIVHRNKTARIKSRLSAAIKNLTTS